MAYKTSWYPTFWMRPWENPIHSVNPIQTQKMDHMHSFNEKKIVKFFFEMWLH